jgi:hypothetical protein
VSVCVRARLCVRMCVCVCVSDSHNYKTLSLSPTHTHTHSHTPHTHSFSQDLYMAMAKGWLSPDHVLILSVEHAKNSLALSKEGREELAKYKQVGAGVCVCVCAEV